MKPFFTIVAFLLLGCTPMAAQNIEITSQDNKPPVITYKSRISMFPDLEKYLGDVIKEFDQIPADRKKVLKDIGTFISKKREAGETAHLVFICTHNSRRSHMSQIWASATAGFYGKGSSIKTYSGGTEATAFNPRAVAAMERAGFHVVDPGGNNPRYEVSFTDKAEPLICFSKKYSDPYNDADDFAAIMVCSDADKNCPVVFGAEARFAVPYIDPKVSDGTDLESVTYDERCRQIAREMAYLMSQVK